jgi:arsenite methyltransferase
MTKAHNQTGKKLEADYGQDVPWLVRTYLLSGTVLAGIGVWLILRGARIVFSSRIGKLRVSAALLDDLHLQGDETVLDLGCGSGLLLINAAKRLPQGRAVGIDLWSQIDLGNNSRQTTLANARLEGVQDRVEVRDGDMQRLPFAAATFDAVVASQSIHNIPTRAGRRIALDEIYRVLKPGGRVAIMDLFQVKEYGEDLQRLGMHDVCVSGPSFWMSPSVRTVTASKPRGETG